MTHSPTEILNQLLDHQELTTEQVEGFAAGLIGEEWADAEKADALRALTAKGETVSEVASFVRVFLRHAVMPQLDQDEIGPAIDVCGTGGDKLDLFNVSTTSMFVLAGGGAMVVKHGNRGITSKSGGADVLEALGIRIDLSPSLFTNCVQQTGVGFMFAPNYHPAFKAIGPVRKLLAAEGTRTVFNLIGPLLNPVRPYFQLVGVADPKMPRMYAEILKKLGRVKAWAVHGTTPEGFGMDELSTLADTKIAQVNSGEISELTLQPADLHLTPASLADLRGGDAAENAKILHGIISGEIKGPKRDIVVLNAAAGFLVTTQANTWEEAWAMAEHVIDSGRALLALKAVQEFCTNVSP